MKHLVLAALILCLGTDLFAQRGGGLQSIHIDERGHVVISAAGSYGMVSRNFQPGITTMDQVKKRISAVPKIERTFDVNGLDTLGTVFRCHYKTGSYNGLIFDAYVPWNAEGHNPKIMPSSALLYRIEITNQSTLPIDKDHFKIGTATRKEVGDLRGRPAKKAPLPLTYTFETITVTYHFDEDHRTTDSKGRHTYYLQGVTIISN